MQKGPAASETQDAGGPLVFEVLRNADARYVRAPYGLLLGRLRVGGRGVIPRDVDRELRGAEGAALALVALAVGRGLALTDTLELLSR